MSTMGAVSFVIPFKYAVLVGLIGLSLAALSEGCYSQSDCEANEVCCSNRCISSSSCAGYSCSSDSDCSKGESCCRQICVSKSNCAGQYCSTKYDCSSGQSCCRQYCVSKSTCVGEYCSSLADCSLGQSCCSGKCRSGSHCIGLSCYVRSDCGNVESCCHGTCQYSYDDCIDSTAAIIAGAVIGSLVLICMISMCIFYTRRHQRANYGRVREQQRTTATTIIATEAIQSNPPHLVQFPPSHQQGYPYHPPLQYEQQQQTTNPHPPPYNPGTMAASEQPPPYTAGPQGRPGGVNAPGPSYGAVPSAPPVKQDLDI